MARRVFFVFHYGRDTWRANVVRNSGAIEGISAGGFRDESVWEKSKREGDIAVRKLINDSLKGTSVTVVLIGTETANRNYLSYEIEQSIAQGNGILGIRINEIKDQYGRTEPPGPIPESLARIGAPVYAWEYGRLGEWLDKAYETAKPER